jgi:hypothetical protein
LAQSGQQARELQEKLMRERIARLLAQAKNLARANEIRSYVEATLARAAEMAAARKDLDNWAMWALQEADRIDPVKNGAVAAAISARASRVDLPVP